MKPQGSLANICKKLHKINVNMTKLLKEQKSEKFSNNLGFTSRTIKNGKVSLYNRNMRKEMLIKSS